MALHSRGLIAEGTPSDVMTPEGLAPIYDVGMDVLGQRPVSDRRVALAR